MRNKIEEPKREQYQIKSIYVSYSGQETMLYVMGWILKPFYKI